MELIRGKTFIKRYAQNPPEKLPRAGGKEKKNVESERTVIECDIKKNDTRTQRMSNSICTNEVDDNVHCPKLVRKSKTNECVGRDDKPKKNTRQNAQGRLSTSLSSPGLVEDPGGKRNDLHTTRQPTCKQAIIDYRNFVPQMPFIPSVAKSLPRKRISLRRPKISLKDIFNLKKNKQQDAISEDEKLQPMIFELKEGRTVEKKHQLNTVEISSDEFLAPEFSDREMYIDAVDPFKALCEDVTSLKSFDSLAGCGEIFADESSSSIDIENSRVTFISKPSSIAASFQGGVERLASPAKSEYIDFSRLRGHIKSSAGNVCSNLLFEVKSLPGSNDAIKKETNNNMAKDQVSNSSYNDLMSSSENMNDAESPMSTSDEGYYDSYSAGLEEDKKEAGTHRSFPRDSYGGDAFYELFCDSSQTKPWAAQDCDLSVSGHNTDNTTSIYSFCEGSEDNVTSQLAFDLDGDGVHQSSWEGREGLLKLCDTEPYLTIGVANWLEKTGKIIESEINHQTLTYNPKEPAEESQVENDNTSVHTITMSIDSKEQITPQWESDRKEASPTGNYIQDSENVLADFPSSTNTEKSESSQTDSNVHIPEDSCTFEAHLDNTDEKSPTLKTLGSIIECEHELSSPHSDTLVPISFLHKLNGTDILPPYNHHDSLQSLGLQYFTNSMSENNSCLVDILEKCAAQVASMHITFGNHSTGKIMRPYEITQNITISVQQNDCGPHTVPVHQDLLSTSDTEANNKRHSKRDTEEPPLPHKMCSKDSKFEYITNHQCILKTSGLLQKERQTSKAICRSNIRTLLKSPCSSVISRCSSVLYRVHNSEDAIIFFNTRKYNQSPCSNDTLLQDSDASSIGFPKYRKDGFQSISPTTCIGERGLLISQNKKWSM